MAQRLHAAALASWQLPAPVRVLGHCDVHAADKVVRACGMRAEQKGSLRSAASARVHESHTGCCRLTAGHTPFMKQLHAPRFPHASPRYQASQ